MDPTSEKYMDFRFGELEKRLDQLTAAVNKLAENAINQATINELVKDVDEQNERLGKIEQEFVFYSRAIKAAWAVVGGLVISKAREFFPGAF